MSQTHGGSDRGAPPSTPRWVKVFVISVIVLVLLVAILHLTGNSLGGPSSHTLPIGAGNTPSIEHGVQPP